MPEFNVSGTWDAIQSNGAIATFDIQQNGTGLTGSASHDSGAVNSIRAGGSVDGIRFFFSVEWDNNAVGEYSGIFNCMNSNPITARLTGITVNINNTFEQAT
jgi:hypothetical protein